MDCDLIEIADKIENYFKKWQWKWIEDQQIIVISADQTRLGIGVFREKTLKHFWQ